MSFAEKVNSISKMPSSILTVKLSPVQTQSVPVFIPSFLNYCHRLIIMHILISRFYVALNDPVQLGEDWQFRYAIYNLLHGLLYWL